MAVNKNAIEVDSDVACITPDNWYHPQLPVDLVQSRRLNDPILNNVPRD